MDFWTIFSIVATGVVTIASIIVLRIYSNKKLIEKVKTTWGDGKTTTEDFTVIGEMLIEVTKMVADVTEVLKVLIEQIRGN